MTQNATTVKDQHATEPKRGRNANRSQEIALEFLHAGLEPVPNDLEAKYPVGVDGWQEKKIDEDQVYAWWTEYPNRVWGLRNIEGLDFDNKGGPDATTLYDTFCSLVGDQAPGLIDRLPLESTPSGGFHLLWRCEVIEGNLKLATRPATAEELRKEPKRKTVTLIETRGLGGQFQVAPSPGYKMLRGNYCELPTITPEERQILLDCARALHQPDNTLPTVDGKGRSNGTGPRPGDEFNERGGDEALSILQASGWRIVSQRGNTSYLCRPGKSRGVSATFGHVAPGVLYIFSSNASPFDPEKAYKPFAVKALLEHNGDFKAAAKALVEKGYGAKVDSLAIASSDQPEQSTDVGTKQQKQSEIAMITLADMGYPDWKLNDCTNTIEVNGMELTDHLENKIHVELDDRNVRYIGKVERAYHLAAFNNRYHPVKDYYTSLEYDGKDTIGALATHLKDAQGTIVHPDTGEQTTLTHIYLKRWLIGAIAKVFDNAQNMMFVLAGTQDKGKSYFAKWLASPMSKYFLESAINTGDKDFLLYLASKWIWEVGELDATTRKADVSALKDFITKAEVTVRPAYGKHSMTKPAMASMIGTVNDDGSGFLLDGTGNRRFMVVTVNDIDHSYTQLKVNQVWAHAMYLYRSGEPYRLTPKEKELQRDNNKQYEVDNVMEMYIQRYFDINAPKDAFISKVDIIEHLRGITHISGNDDMLFRQLNRAARRLGLETTRRNHGTLAGFAGIEKLPHLSIKSD